MTAFIRTPRDAAAARSRLAHGVLGAEEERREWLERTLLRPGQVAVLLQVSRRTVAEWASTGRLASIRTPGGHRRFRASDVRSLIDSLAVAGPGGWRPSLPADPD